MPPSWTPSGSVRRTEVRGHLRKRVLISCSPTVAPVVYVATATYGITPTARRDRYALYTV
jgi:hypothetical protein